MKTLKESWLNGTPKKKYINFLMGGPLPTARSYFKNWTDREIKEFWHDLEKILKGFINTIGKKSYLTNPLTILASDSLLSVYKPFSDFYAKWIRKMERIESNGEPIYLSKILLSVYLLKKAADEKISEVIDISDRLSTKNLYEINLKSEGKKAISAQNKRNAKYSKKSILRQKIESTSHIKRKKVNYMIIISELNKLDGVRIKIIENDITFKIKTKNNKIIGDTISLKNFIKLVSKIKIAIARCSE